MVEKELNEVKYFGLLLNQTSASILFVLTLTAMINSIYPLLSSFLSLPMMINFPVNENFISFLLSFFGLLAIVAIYIYTLFAV